MIGQLQLDTVQNQRDKLAQSIDTLETTRENLGSSVALMCGLDANTIVMPADFETLYEGNLDKMSYQKDLEQAQKNSFLIWQKQDAVRSAYTRTTRTSAVPPRRSSPPRTHWRRPRSR